MDNNAQPRGATSSDQNTAASRQPPKPPRFCGNTKSARCAPTPRRPTGSMTPTRISCDEPNRGCPEPGRRRASAGSAVRCGLCRAGSSLRGADVGQGRVHVSGRSDPRQRPSAGHRVARGDVGPQDAEFAGRSACPRHSWSKPMTVVVPRAVKAKRSSIRAPRRASCGRISYPFWSHHRVEHVRRS
ncbi:MAG: hypothetical protein QOK02_6832 [Mycobacterium sp.]|jgi:hypothetical protein|nr:hypothetical protein [Mycobacterium sp.]